MPADSKGAEETLRRIRRATAALKWSRQAAADFLCQKQQPEAATATATVAATTAAAATAAALFKEALRCNAPVYFCGSEITEVQVEVVSYAGRIFFSISYDPTVVTKGHLLPKLFVEELHGLARSLGLKAHAAGGEKQQKWMVSERDVETHRGDTLLKGGPFCRCCSSAL
ncbi:hypothetical protein Emed_002692 [Eimeria media]